MGIYSVGTKSVYQIGQSGNTKCFTSVSREGLIRELLTKHSCLHPVLTLRIPVIYRAYASFHGMLSRELPVKTLLSSIAWVFIVSLYHTTLTIKSHNKHTYKRLNKITIKFGTELKPTKQIVVNYNFTISPFGYFVTTPKTDFRLKHDFENSGKTYSHLI